MTSKINLTFKINFTLPDGSDDYVIVEAETIEEIQEKASYEVAMRNAIDYWSEKLSAKDD